MSSRSEGVTRSHGMTAADRRGDSERVDVHAGRAAIKLGMQGTSLIDDANPHRQDRATSWFASNGWLCSAFIRGAEYASSPRGKCRLCMTSDRTSRLME